MSTKPTPKARAKDSHKESRPRRRRKAGPPSADATRPRLSDDDAHALDLFCKNVEIDEVSLAEWEECQASLDLTVPLFLSPDEAHAGVDKTLHFSRTTKPTKSSSGARKPVSCLISVPSKASDGQTLLIKGEGDQLGEAHGNLKVIIRIKSRS